MKKSKIYLDRLIRLQNVLKAKGYGAFFISNPLDLFYFTGLQLSMGHLVVTPHKSTLFVDGRYFEMTSKKSPFPVEKLESDKEVAFIRGVSSLGFNSEKTFYNNYLSLRKMAKKQEFPCDRMTLPCKI